MSLRSDDLNSVGELYSKDDFRQLVIALGAWGAGVALDAAGGPAQPTAWLALFVLLAAGILLGPFALWWLKADK